MMKKRKNGSITVFLALIILLVLSLVCTVIEISRVSSSYARSNEITYMALDSTFSSYAREVFEDYGVMLLWKNKDEAENNYRKYVSKNSDYKKDFLNYPIDILGIREKSTNITSVNHATDGDGEYIYKQIYDYMKVAVSEDVIDKILNNCESLSQSEEIEEIYEKLDYCSEKLKKIESSVGEIKTSVANIQKIQNSPKTVLENMKGILEQIINIEPTDSYNNEVRDNLFNAYKIEFRKYVEWEDITRLELNNILMNTNDYYVYTNDAKKYVNAVENELNISENKYSEEVFNLLKEEIENLKTEINNQDKDVYRVLENKNNTVTQQKIANNIFNDMSSIMDETKELNYSGNKLSNYQGGNELILKSYDNVCKAIISVKEYNSGNLGVNYKESSGGKKKNEIVEFVKKLKKNGILSYITDGKLSDKKIDTQELPSYVTKINNGKDWVKCSDTNEAIRKALVGQYIFDKFKNYTDDEHNGKLEYEIEYIMYGKPSDKENLEKITNKLLLIREGFNLVHLCKDSVKREEAYTLALTIIGYTGMPAIIRITQFLILGAWAYAESVVDVKDLLNGYKVNLLKKSDEWNLSLSGITKLESSNENKEKQSGLSYEDYLRFMLFTQNKAVQVYRIMDLIEMNVQKKYNKNFHMNKCIVKISVNTEYIVKRVFSLVGYSGKLIMYKDDKFILKIKQSFGY